MASKGLLRRISTTKLFLATLAAGLSLLIFAEQAQAIPVFAQVWYFLHHLPHHLSQTQRRRRGISPQRLSVPLGR